MSHAIAIAVGTLACLFLETARPETTGDSPSAPIVAGVSVSAVDSQWAPTAPRLPPSLDLGVGGFSIDFDDVSAPCEFSSTLPLRTEYLALGVSFRPQRPKDGGAILDECSNFGVTGHSSPNFLAFNAGAGYPGGGFARDPELLRFTTPHSHVELKAGDGFSTGTLTLTGFDVFGMPVATDSISISPALQTMTLDGPGIVLVVLDCTAPTFVVDDLVVN